ncbi:hypothetical protein RRG08_058771 [Elysia crispata]|uniref:Uncharacterized protein n=1 Tax=Elysia crispata TaxID=231223 RepID=A0AAE0YXT1_9GAST|nr:hypothetical protein RRG08_058771 [Elysia crispata]
MTSEQECNTHLDILQPCDPVTTPWRGLQDDIRTRVQDAPCRADIQALTSYNHVILSLGRGEVFKMTSEQECNMHLDILQPCDPVTNPGRGLQDEIRTRVQDAPCLADVQALTSYNRVILSPVQGEVFKMTSEQECNTHLDIIQPCDPVTSPGRGLQDDIRTRVQDAP